ncbi:RING-H2 finger protein ATL56 [Linum grandiflorum]
MFFITTTFCFFLGVAAILLLIATLAFHRHSKSNSNPSDYLKKLPDFRFPKRPKSEEGDVECVVCLDGIKQGQWCRMLCGCGHVFHRRCVDTWLSKVPSCPICRARVQLDSGSWAQERKACLGWIGRTS